MELLIWAGVFIISLIALIKGADWVLDSSKKIGIALGFSPFVVGVLIIGFGTSAPELVSSIAGVLSNAKEIPVANAVGSNIANILLVVGASAIVARGAYAASRSLIDLEIPLLVLATFFFFGVVFDGAVSQIEAVFLLVGFVIYLLYTLIHSNGKGEKKAKREKISFTDIVLLVVGFILLIAGARYLIQSVLELSGFLNISVGVITLLAVALGTSLPELFVSAKAALSGNAEVSIGNIFGSNIFNLLLVVGIPGLITPLVVDTATLTVALPVMLAVTIFFAISGLSQKIHVWEGAFYLLIYVFFVGKLFGLF